MENNEIEPFKMIVDSQFSKDLYKDAVSPFAIQLGKFGSDFLKTIRLILFPVQVGAAIQDRIEKTFNKVADQVPYDKRVEPSIQISGQILEKIRFTNDGDELSQMFEELLKTSIDKDHVMEAHPAFPHIISQLSRDEAFLIQEITKGKLNVIDVLSLDTKQQKFTDRIIETSTIPTDKMFYKDNLNIYYTHLHSLGLVEWPVTKQDPIYTSGTQSGVRRFSNIELTDFGLLFAKACLPKNGLT